MAFNGGVVAGQGYVAKRLCLIQMVQHRQQIVLVVVPFQTKHLGQRVHFGNGQLWQQTEKKKKGKTINKLNPRSNKQTIIKSESEGQVKLLPMAPIFYTWDFLIIVG